MDVERPLSSEPALGQALALHRHCMKWALRCQCRRRPVHLPPDCCDSSPTEFSPALDDLVAGGLLLTSPGMLWQAATEDAAANVEETSVYVARVHHGLKAFISSDELSDREGTISELNRLMSDVGQFVEVVGAKNQGKSHIALALVKQLNAGGKHHAIIVNARDTGSDLSDGIIASLRQFVGDDFARSVLHTAAAAVNAFLPGAGAVVDSLSGSGSVRVISPQALVAAFVSSCKAAKKYPVIVIDEAVLALAAVASAAKQNARDLLAFFVRITKKQKLAHVLLLASCYAEGARFKDLGFNVEALSEVIVAAEVPPAKMLGLLAIVALHSPLRCWGSTAGPYGQPTRPSGNSPLLRKRRTSSRLSQCYLLWQWKAQPPASMLRAILLPGPWQKCCMVLRKTASFS